MSLDFRPKLVDVLASKKVRLIASALAGFFILLTLIQFSGDLASLHGFLPGRPVLLSPSTPDAEIVDWTRFAYTQYVTNSEYLCNSVMIFESLHKLNSKADRVLMYPSNMFDPDTTEAISDDAHLLLKARDEYNVQLKPIVVQHRDGADGTWADSFTKLLAFNQTAYDRVLSLDSDGIVMQVMDELFLLPPSPVAMPRAYWLYPDKPILSSQVMLVEPSDIEFKRVLEKTNNAGPDDYDMEIVNYLYKDSAMVLPHRPYDMLTAEFRAKDHSGYLGTDKEKWDPVAIYNEAKFVHFSDWPVSKPWLSTPENILEEKQPECDKENGAESCVEREIWHSFYDDFKEKRKHVCEESPVSQRRRRS